MLTWNTSDDRAIAASDIGQKFPWRLACSYMVDANSRFIYSWGDYLISGWGDMYRARNHSRPYYISHSKVM